jgi:hypothetical protein
VLDVADNGDAKPFRGSDGHVARITESGLSRLEAGVLDEGPLCCTFVP